MTTTETTTVTTTTGACGDTIYGVECRHADCLTAAGNPRHTLTGATSYHEAAAAAARHERNYHAPTVETETGAWVSDAGLGRVFIPN